MTTTTNRASETTYETIPARRVRMGDRIDGAVVESVTRRGGKVTIELAGVFARTTYAAEAPIRIVTSYMTRHGFKLYRVVFGVDEIRWVSIPE